VSKNLLGGWWGMNKITNEQYTEMCREKIIDFLKGSSVKERHQLVNEWNWRGFGIHELKWIANDPDTDKATALQIYWKAGPRINAKIFSDRNEVPWYMLDEFDLIEDIEKNYVSGFYKSQNFGFDPHKDMFGYASDEEYDWTTEYLDFLNKKGKIMRDIPSVMLEKLDGIKIPHTDDWIEGIPPHIYEELRKLQDLI